MNDIQHKTTFADKLNFLIFTLKKQNFVKHEKNRIIKPQRYSNFLYRLL